MNKKLNHYLTKSANSALHDKPFVEYLKAESAFLDPLKPSIKFRMICLRDDVTEIPKCDCGQPLSIEASYKVSFTQFCSPKCRAINNKVIPISKSDLYENRHLSLEALARKFDIKTPSLFKAWFKKYNIDRPEDYLNDKDWLYNEYITNKKTVYEIADELQSSPARVSVYLNKHDIQTRTIVDYDIVSNFTSKGEIADWLELCGVSVVRQYRKLGKELDIYCPQFDIAIEYNGLYWHSEKFKDKDFHAAKFNLCHDNGIYLFQVWEDDWATKPDLIKSMISSRLQFNSRLNARQCTIKEVDVDTKNQFLEDNHIQGKDWSRFKYGLYHDDMLVSVMTFGTPRFTKDVDYELIRFATLRGYTVVGGASKLLSHFRKKHNGTIVSYADNDYSNGGLYSTLNFIKGDTSPKYYWVRNGKKYPRYKFRKTDTLTEKENAESQGFTRLWASGVTRWILE